MLDAMDKLELGKALEKFRIMSVRYYPKIDTYSIWFLDKDDNHICDTIKGSELE